MDEKTSDPPAENREAPVRRADRGTAVLLPGVLFVLGVLVGALAFLTYGILSDDPLLVRQLGQQGVDVAQIRDAARAGTLDAIATVQAGGVPASSPTPAATPTPLPKTAFAVRDANRIGRPDAPVTIVEYSDFQ